VYLTIFQKTRVNYIITSETYNNHLIIVSQGAYFGQYVPILLFGIISTMAGATAFLLPETKDKKLPDTVRQVELVREV